MLNMGVPLRLKNLAVRQYNVPVPWIGVAVTAQIVCPKLATGDYFTALKIRPACGLVLPLRPKLPVQN